MKMITTIFASLLYVSFNINAAQSADETIAPMKQSQQVSVYSVTTVKKDALKNIIKDVEKRGFSTSTADLNNLDNSIIVFKNRKDGEKLSPALLKPIINKQADIRNEWQSYSPISGVVTLNSDDTSISLKNEIVSRIDSGNVKLAQGISIYDNGNERHSFQDVGVNKDGSVINIIMTSPGRYFIMLTTI